MKPCCIWLWFNLYLCMYIWLCWIKNHKQKKTCFLKLVCNFSLIYIKKWDKNIPTFYALFFRCFPTLPWMSVGFPACVDNICASSCYDCGFDVLDVGGCAHIHDASAKHGCVHRTLPLWRWYWQYVSNSSFRRSGSVDLFLWIVGFFATKKMCCVFWWNQISYSYESQRVRPPKHHGVLPNNTQHQISYHIISSLEIYEKQTSKQVTVSLFIPYFIPSKHIYYIPNKITKHQDVFLHVFFVRLSCHRFLLLPMISLEAHIWHPCDWVDSKPLHRKTTMPSPLPWQSSRIPMDTELSLGKRCNFLYKPTFLNVYNIHVCERKKNPGYMYIY